MSELHGGEARTPPRALTWDLCSRHHPWKDPSPGREEAHWRWGVANTACSLCWEGQGDDETAVFLPRLRLAASRGATRRRAGPAASGVLLAGGAALAAPVMGLCAAGFPP